MYLSTVELIDTFGSTEDDLELWRCAHRQRNLYGDVALVMVNRRLRELSGQNDPEEMAKWLAVAMRLVHLGRGRGDEPRH